jgi:hypothetical protein
MRPAGDVRQALFTAACTFHNQGMPATLRELAHKSQVGLDDARRCVDNMKRAGDLTIVGTRRVDYRNRPVSEYAPAVQVADQIQQGWVDLGQCMSAWAR